MGVLVDAAFWVLAVIAVVFGVAVFVVDSMARASYALAVSFIAVGIALLLVGLDYVGLITILMMVMEMAIMAVFMVMFMGMNPALMPMNMVHSQRTAIVLSVGTFIVLAVGAVAVPWPTRRGAPAADNAAALGEVVMGPKMLVMIVVSAVIFATIVAGLVLTTARNRYDRFGDDLSARPRAGPRQRNARAGVASQQRAGRR